MKALPALAVFALLLGGCESIDESRLPAWLRSGPVEPVDDGTTVIRAVPESSVVTFTDGTTCETPCRVRRADGTLFFTVANEGYAAQRLEMTLETPPVVDVVLEPVGRSVAVEEVDLPPLE